MSYVSITGLKIKSPKYIFHFWWYAIRSIQQVKNANGLIDVRVTKRNGYQHTLTIWESRAAMLDFMKSGVHAVAIQSFHKIASGKTLGFERDEPLEWDEAISLWEDRARQY
jgi:hypothetical protein